MILEKHTVIITLAENKRGGPYLSHIRIMNNLLDPHFDFIPFYIPRLRELIKPHVFISLVRKIRSINPSVYHFYGLQIDGFFSLLIARVANKKIPTVLSIRGSSLEAVYFNRIYKFIVHQMEKYTLKKATITYGVSKYVSSWRDIHKYCNNYYGHIYNYLPRDYIEPSVEMKRELRKRYGINERDIVVISTGRITIEKGFKDLEILINRDDFGKNVVFLIVGDGHYLETMQNSIIAENCKVVFTGHISNVNELLSISDVFITLSWHETLGNSIIEAKLKGLPSVVTNVGGIPELIKDNHSGFIIDKNDIDSASEKLHKLINSKEERIKMSNFLKNEMRLSEQNKIISEQLVEVYNKAIKLRRK